MTQLETELVWLTRKVAEDERRIRKIQDYFDTYQHQWSRGVMETYFKSLERLRDQHYFESTRLEKLAWRVHEERERMAGREGLNPN